MIEVMIVVVNSKPFHPFSKNDICLVNVIFGLGSCENHFPWGKNQYWFHKWQIFVNHPWKVLIFDNIPFFTKQWNLQSKANISISNYISNPKSFQLSFDTYRLRNVFDGFMGCKLSILLRLASYNDHSTRFEA